MDLGLKSKIAVVTGGSEGIGRATVLRLAQEGANVALCARRKEPLEQVAAEAQKHGVQALAVTADMSKAADIERFMKAVVDRFGRIDILVNNAGTSKRGEFLELSDEEWHADLELKVFGAIRCTRLAVPHMKKNGGGRIVNITISSAKQPGAGSYPTSVSRAAGLAITKALVEGVRRRQHPREHGVHRAYQVGTARAALHETGHQPRGCTTRSPRRGFRWGASAKRRKSRT